MSDCDTSKVQNDVMELPQSTYKRRSSLFQHYAARRVEAAEMTVDVDEDKAKKIGGQHEPESEITASSESFDLLSYIEKLRKERREWKETLNARKSRRRNLQKQLATIQRDGADFDLSLLSESERFFMLDRPDYQQINKNIENLAEAAVKVAILDRELKITIDRLTLKIERELRNATTKVIIMSTEI